MHKFPPLVSRRTFIRGSAAVAAGALLPTPLLTGAIHAKNNNSAFSVGLILPSIPAFTTEFHNGLNLALRQQSTLGSTLTFEYGSSVATAYDVAQELLKNNAHVLVAGVGTKGAAELEPLLTQYQRPLLSVNAGEDIAQPGQTKPFTFYATLGLWQAAYALGQWTAQKIGTRGLSAASCYDSGYDHLYAFEKGFTDAGGTLLYTHVSHRPIARDEFDGLISAVQTHQPDFLFAAYQGDLAKQLANVYGSGALGNIPLLGSSFIAPVYGNWSAISWADTLQNRAAVTFIQGYQSMFRQTPTAFAALGWDTGTLLATAYKTIGRADDGRAWAAALSSVAIESPRGTLRMNADTHTLDTPLYLGWSDGRALQIQGTLSAPSSIPIAEDGLRSGWLQTYLC